MKYIFCMLMLLYASLGWADAVRSDKSLRFLFSAGGGAYPDGSVFGLHLRFNGDRVTEYKDFGLGLGMEFAKSNLTVARESDSFFYSFDYLLGLRFFAILRTSDIYSVRLVFAGGPTRVTYHPSRFASIQAGVPLGFEVSEGTADHQKEGLYASLGVHFQREHPSLVRLSEWGMTLTLYRASFPTGWFREGLHNYARAPGPLNVLLLSLHVGIGGIIDL